MLLDPGVLHCDSIAKCADHRASRHSLAKPSPWRYDSCTHFVSAGSLGYHKSEGSGLLP